MEVFTGILPGIAEMANIHPVFLHLPLALLSAFVLMEALGAITDRESMRNAATWMLYLGTLGAVVTVITGLAAAGGVGHNEEVHKLMLSHRDHGLVVLAIAIILSIWRLTVGARFSVKGRALHFVLAMIMVGIMAVGADKGGMMVYKYGVSVKAAPQTEESGGHDHGGGLGHLTEEGEATTKDMEDMEGVIEDHHGNDDNDNGSHEDASPHGH